MTDKEVAELQKRAHSIRRSVIEMTTAAGSGHVGGSLSVTDIITILFFKIMEYNPSDLTKSRDRFVLSAGHVCPALYATFAEKSYIKKEELLELRKLDSPLQGHPSHIDLPIIETSSGSLGQGLSIALGKALSIKMDGAGGRVYCVMSDGEQEEGSTWEAAMAASHYKTGNLVGIIDRNNMQIGGSTENIISLAPLQKKYESFGWRVVETDGHNFSQLQKAFYETHDFTKPTIIIAHTTMGKGIPSIENDFRWHGKVFTKKESRKALEELDLFYEREISRGYQ